MLAAALKGKNVVVLSFTPLLLNAIPPQVWSLLPSLHKRTLFRLIRLFQLHSIRLVNFPSLFRIIPQFLSLFGSSIFVRLSIQWSLSAYYMLLQFFFGCSAVTEMRCETNCYMYGGSSGEMLFYTHILHTDSTKPREQDNILDEVVWHKLEFETLNSLVF